MRTLTALAPLLFSSLLSAQVCSDNVYTAHLVNSLGVPALIANGASQFNDDQVYLAFDPAIPSGTYYVHVTTRINLDGTDQVLSLNDPMDRIVQVTNNAGVISLALPFQVNPPTLGLGLNGVGQSIYVGPFAPDPDNTCEWKVWFGDCWDVNATPGGIVMGGFNQTTQQCCIRSFSYFQIGGPTNDICGDVFLDTNGNGAHDPGEGGVAGITVKLSGPSGPASVQTDANGHYCFLDVTPGDYTVMLDLTGSPLMPTTPTMAAVVANGCADGTAPDFGLKPQPTSCDGHTPGYWSNKNGIKRINDNNILPTLGGLCLVDGSGNLFVPANTNQWRTWLLGGNAVNMAYMLSVQLAAMWCNVQSGFVSGDCVVDGGSLGNITINSLIAQAVASLCAHPLTLSGSLWRAEQEALKDALDAANNNLNWL